MRARRKTNRVNKAALESKFAADVFQRDGRVCRMQIWRNGRWNEHGIKGSALNPLDPSHIYKRADCGTLAFDKIVGIASCRDCHDRYEGKLRDGVYVRVPPERERRAYKAICIAVTTFRVPRKQPPLRPVRDDVEIESEEDDQWARDRGLGCPRMAAD